MSTDQPDDVQDTIPIDLGQAPLGAQPEPVEPAPTAPAPMAPARPGPRVGTVVWGLILAVIGVGVIAAAAGAQFDVELVSIALLALAGVGLVVGSIATSVRRRHS